MFWPLLARAALVNKKIQGFLGDLKTPKRNLKIKWPLNILYGWQFYITYFSSYFWLILTVRIEFWKQVSKFCTWIFCFSKKIDGLITYLFQFDSKLIRNTNLERRVWNCCAVWRECEIMYDVHTAWTVNAVLGWLLILLKPWLLILF